MYEKLLKNPVYVTDPLGKSWQVKAYGKDDNFTLVSLDSESVEKKVFPSSIGELCDSVDYVTIYKFSHLDTKRLWEYHLEDMIAEDQEKMLPALEFFLASLKDRPKRTLEYYELNDPRCKDKARRYLMICTPHVDETDQPDRITGYMAANGDERDLTWVWETTTRWRYRKVDLANLVTDNPFLLQLQEHCKLTQ